MPTTTLWARFNGFTDVNSLYGPIGWNSRFIGYYSQYEEDAADNLTANIRLTGNNWTVASMRFGAASRDTQLNLRDLNGSAGREIQYLQLGYNSDVDLISTRAAYILGYDGDLHDLVLGSAHTRSIDLSADRNVVTTGSGHVGNINIGGENDGVAVVRVNGSVGRIGTDDGNDRLIVNSNGDVDTAFLRGGNDVVIVRGEGRIENLHSSGGGNESTGGGNEVTVQDQGVISTLQLGRGNNTVRILGDDARIRYMKFTEGDNTLEATGYVESIVSWQSNNTFSLGSGGTGSMIFYSADRMSHQITSAGYVESLRVSDRSGTDTDDQTTSLTFTNGAGAGSVQLGAGNDWVRTDGYVDFINTGRGNDIVTVGTGGMGTLVMHDGDDMVRLRGFDNPNVGIVLQGRAGSDTVNFVLVADSGVTFTLDAAGQWQNIGAPGGGLNLDPAIGWVSETGFENVIGTKRADALTGDQNDNELSGRGGHDLLNGGAGGDILRGQFGNDVLNGQEGRDMIFGGVGQDTITGGADNDNLSGQEGADVFVFGADDGFDSVRDFEDGADLLRIADHVGGFGGLAFSDRGDNLRIDHDGGSILLIGMAGTVLTNADFEFV